jgi:hypothetical protein
MVEDRPLNTIRPARYVRRLSLLRCSFILKSLFGTARGFYLWVSNGRANLNLLTTLLQLFTTNGLRRVPASHVRGSISSDLEYSPYVGLAGNLGPVRVARGRTCSRNGVGCKARLIATVSEASSRFAETAVDHSRIAGSAGVA